MADILSWVTTQLNPETVKSILGGVTLGTAHWAKVHDPAMFEGDQHLEWEVCVTADCPLVEMHVTDLAKSQREDPTLSTVLDWLEAQKKTILKVLLAEHTSSEEGNLILHNQQNFTIHQVALYLCLMPQGKTEDLSLHGPQGASCCCLELVPPRCQPSRAWSNLVPVVAMLLVARDGQPNAEILEVLHMLLAAWGQVVQGAPTPDCVYCSNGSYM